VTLSLKAPPQILPGIGAKLETAQGRAVCCFDVSGGGQAKVEVGFHCSSNSEAFGGDNISSHGPEPNTVDLQGNGVRTSRVLLECCDPG
jgi:hypothetical protein